MDENKIKLTLEDICKLYKEDKLIAGENVPGDNVDYPDGWEDEEGIYTVEDLLDLILYLSGQKNLCNDADRMLGLEKKNRNSTLNGLMRIFDEYIYVSKEKDKYILSGNIDNMLSGKLYLLKDSYIKQDTEIIKEIKEEGKELKI